jgi:hypothetical protein
VLGNRRLSQTLDEEARIGEGLRVCRHRPMGTHEGHLQASASDVVLVERRLEIGALDRERAVRLIATKTPGRVQRMNDGEAQPAASLQHAGGFLDGGRHLVHILKRHERNDAIERSVREGQSGRIC